MLKRYNDAIDANIGIVTPHETNTTIPFSDRHYNTKALGNLHDNIWDDIRSNGITNIIPKDIYAKSRYRDTGLAIWDAAIAIPSSILVPTNVVNTNEIVPVRNCNTDISEITFSLDRVGNLGGDRLRPENHSLYDATKDKDSRTILDIAHSLAHYHSGNCQDYYNLISTLVFCRKFNLKFDINRIDGGLSDYGILMVTSSRFRNPTLTVNTQGKFVLSPDKYVAVALASIFIEPHPYGYTNLTNSWKSVNRWASTPSLVQFWGWEGVDVITHLYKCRSKFDNIKRHTMFGANVSDLQEPSRLSSLTDEAKLYRSASGEYVDTIISEGKYSKIAKITPALPCRECFRLNRHAEGLPGLPNVKRPEPRKPGIQKLIRAGRVKPTKAEIVWSEYDAEISKIFDIVEKATVFYEGTQHGHDKVKRYRRLRSANYNKLKKLRSRLVYLDSEIKRLVKLGQPGKRKMLIEEKSEIENMLMELRVE